MPREVYIFTVSCLKETQIDNWEGVISSLPEAAEMVGPGTWRYISPSEAIFTLLNAGILSWGSGVPDNFYVEGLRSSDLVTFQKDMLFQNEFK